MTRKVTKTRLATGHLEYLATLHDARSRALDVVLDGFEPEHLPLALLQRIRSGGPMPLVGTEKIAVSIDPSTYNRITLLANVSGLDASEVMRLATEWHQHQHSTC